jgi:hypothetical protein
LEENEMGKNCAASLFMQHLLEDHHGPDEQNNQNCQPRKLPQYFQGKRDQTHHIEQT